MSETKTLVKGLLDRYETPGRALSAARKLAAKGDKGIEACIPVLVELCRLRDRSQRALRRQVNEWFEDMVYQAGGSRYVKAYRELMRGK